jgi:VanZ family protein
MLSRYSEFRTALLTPRLRRLAAALSGLIALAILIVCLLPGSDLPHVPLTDKIEHLIAYAGLSAPLAVALGPKRLWMTLVLAIAYGGFVEIAQGLAATGRSASWLDALANAIGAVLGTGLMASVFRSGPRPHRS